MSTTDRAAFEQYAESQGCRDFEYDQDDSQRYRNPFTQREYKYWRAALDWQAATEAAKATGTAGELPQDVQELFDYLRPEIDYYCKTRHNALKALKSLERKFRELSAEAARQPVPAVAVKTWESRLAGNPDRIFSEVVRRAMEAEISDLRVAVAASQQSKNLMAICEALRPFAEAYKPEHHTQTDDPKFQEFLDRNQITPNVTMGNFRRAHEAYLAATNRSQP